MRAESSSPRARAIGSIVVVWLLVAAIGGAQVNGPTVTATASQALTPPSGPTPPPELHAATRTATRTATPVKEEGDPDGQDLVRTRTASITATHIVAPANKTSNFSATVVEPGPRSRTLTLQPEVPTPAPTNGTPAPTLSSEDRIQRNFDFFAAAIFDVPLFEFARNVDNFAATYIRPAMHDPTLEGRIILLEYCGMPVSGASEVAVTSWNCAGSQVPAGNAPYTWLTFAFVGSEGMGDLASLELEALPLVTVFDGTKRFMFQVVENAAPQPSAAPGVVSRATATATTPAGVIVVLLFVSVILCLCAVFINRCRKQKGEPGGGSIGGGEPGGDVEMDARRSAPAAASAMSRAAPRAAAYASETIDYDDDDDGATTIPPVVSVASSAPPRPPSVGGTQGRAAPAPQQEAAPPKPGVATPPQVPSPAPQPQQQQQQQHQGFDLFAQQPTQRPQVPQLSTRQHPESESAAATGGALASPTAVDIPLDDSDFESLPRPPPATQQRQ